MFSAIFNCEVIVHTYTTKPKVLDISLADFMAKITSGGIGGVGTADLISGGKPVLSLCTNCYMTHAKTRCCSPEAPSECMDLIVRLDGVLFRVQ